MPTLAAALLEGLKDHGAREIFGIPGDFVLPFFKGHRRKQDILVRHSHGGILITAAGIDPHVAGLVYIAALAMDADEASQSQQAQFAVTDVFSHIDVADGRIWLKREGSACFAGDLPKQVQKVVWGNARRIGCGPVRQISFIPRKRGFFRIML